jgi:hypothetical protein
MDGDRRKDIVIYDRANTQQGSQQFLAKVVLVAGRIRFAVDAGQSRCSRFVEFPGLIQLVLQLRCDPGAGSGPVATRGEQILRPGFRQLNNSKCCGPHQDFNNAHG